jgi:hypothetical protein
MQNIIPDPQRLGEGPQKRKGGEGSFASVKPTGIAMADQVNQTRTLWTYSCRYCRLILTFKNYDYEFPNP